MRTFDETVTNRRGGLYAHPVGQVGQVFGRE